LLVKSWSSIEAAHRAAARPHGRPQRPPLLLPTLERPKSLSREKWIDCHNGNPVTAKRSRVGTTYKRALSRKFHRARDSAKYQDRSQLTLNGDCDSAHNWYHRRITIQMEGQMECANLRDIDSPN
jgi:hypothetical protein